MFIPFFFCLVFTFIIIIMVLLWPFYPPYWLASYPGLTFLSLAAERSVSSADLQSLPQTQRGRREEQGKSRIQEPQAGAEGTCWPPAEKGVSGKREIRKLARHSTVCGAGVGGGGVAVGGCCVRQNRDAKQRWVGVPGGSSALRIWGAKTWGWCQGWSRGQYFSSLMFRQKQLKQGCILEVLVVKSTDSEGFRLELVNCKMKIIIWNS